MKGWAGAGALLLAGLCWRAQAAPAAAQPQIDLGQTSFLDGDARPGWLLETIGNGIVAHDITDAAGHALPGRNRQWTASLTLHPAFIGSSSVLGAHPGIEFLIPTALVHLDLSGQPSVTQGGVGDVTVAPMLQWQDGHLLEAPFSFRAAVQFVAPVGTYSRDRQVNAGQNTWQVSPYAAFTVRPAPAWELSGRLIYDWSARNPHPPKALGADSSQAGEQVVLDLAASRALGEGWRLGLAGYALRQVSAGRVGGATTPGSEQQVLALGPGAVWSDGHGATVIGNVFREFASRNRPEGYNAVLRLLLTF